MQEVASGVTDAFESARAQIDGQGKCALAVADHLLGAIIKLPLVTA
ncbi:hypothetical protein AB6813_01745 [bacterium RCC_150]